MRPTLPTLVVATLLAASLSFADEKKNGDAKKKDKAPKSVHDFKVKTILDEDFDMRKLEGRVILLVNVASQ